jgi:hypothetical protein
LGKAILLWQWAILAKLFTDGEVQRSRTWKTSKQILRAKLVDGQSALGLLKALHHEGRMVRQLV